MAFFDKLKFDPETEEGSDQNQTERIPARTQGVPEAPAEDRVVESESEAESEAEGQLAVDVYQTRTELVVSSTIAGVNPENIDVAIENDTLTIRGTRNKQEDIPPEAYFSQECFFGPFSRSIILPVEVDSEKYEASIQNGVLTIRLPKLKKQEVRKLNVKLT